MWKQLKTIAKQINQMVNQIRLAKENQELNLEIKWCDVLAVLLFIYNGLQSSDI